MANITHQTCTEPNCNAPHFGRGFCNKHYYRNVRRPKRPVTFGKCQWCGKTKPISEMRNPSVDRGKTPSTCYSCREANPSLGWCTFHNEPHPRERFVQRPQFAMGISNICVGAQSEKASAARALPEIRCDSCKDLKRSWEFTGGRQKARTCRTCTERHPNERWCVGCSDWLHTDMFQRTGKGGKFQTVRCNPCRAAHAHGMSVAEILKRQGTTRPQCGSCGSVDMLQIDHDHACCPGATGCAECVIGYLCHQCNTSEGLLRTPERALLLYQYMVSREELRQKRQPLPERV